MNVSTPGGIGRQRVWLCVVVLIFGVACESGPRSQTTKEPPEYRQVAGEMMPDTRRYAPIPPQAGKEHRAVMLQHLETVQAIMAALAEEDFERAKGLTEVHQSFFGLRHSWPIPRTESPRPSYGDLAKAHYDSAESLIQSIPSRDYRQIIPRFNGLLQTCVACHLEYRVVDVRAPAQSPP